MSGNWKYDVFLSFRGEDTRKGFTDYLYHALDQKGIVVFRDDNELERGKEIPPALVKAIDDSRFSVVVFSRNYASSSWCLDELVKIVECRCRNHRRQQMVFPIFYGVDPTVVRKQTGCFSEAFVKHGEDFSRDMGKVQKWREALKEVANLAGWDLRDRHEVEFIEEIVKEISSKLIPRTTRSTLNDIVAMDSRLEELRSLIDSKPQEVCMIGVTGMGGIGKTTIARVVYDLISGQFEGSCFLANVRETSEKFGMITLQKQLLSQLLNLHHDSIWDEYNSVGMQSSRLRHKKVLLVIDDVVHSKQLISLAGKPSWFGAGSRIIITSRDTRLLIEHGVDQVYKLKELRDDEALELFCAKAFKTTHQPTKEYEQLSKRFVKYAGGLPLALTVLGSFMVGRSIQEWESAVERLKTDPENEILDVLEIGFAGLKETEKKIFLDVACFLKGKDKDYVMKILEGCGFHPGIGMSVLTEKSMLTISDRNKVWMHDLLQEMGQRIVERQSIEELGRRTRLWKQEDVHQVLTENRGTAAVEVITLDSDPKEKACLSLSSDAFLNMTNLRMLKVGNVQLPQGSLDYLSNELRLLEWHEYPLRSLPSNLQLDKMVELNMRSSNIKHMLTVTKPLNNLRFMSLGHSRKVTRTPDFILLPNLEKLVLKGCSSLSEIHPSLMVHKRLVKLNLKLCTNLASLPGPIDMESLRKLSISGCSKISKFPEISGNMECLAELLLDGTAIKELPPSVKLLSGLVVLNMKDCRNLKSLSSATISCLKCLKTLNLSGCYKLESVPETLGQVESLEELDVSGTAVRQPAKSIFLLKNLRALSFRGCKGPSLSSMPWYLRFSFNLMPRKVSDYKALTLPYLSGLRSLTRLDLSDCDIGEGAIPIDICNLSTLKDLDLSKNNFISIPSSINLLTHLTSLVLEECKMLKSLPQLPPLIQQVNLDGCSSLETLQNALNFLESDYKYFNCIDCLKLHDNIQSAFLLLKEYLLEGSSQSYNPSEYLSFSIVVPGSKIPEWFLFKEEGSSITVMRPTDSYDKSKVVGYAVYCVFEVNKHLPPVRSRKHQLYCQMNVDKTPGPFLYIFGFKRHLGQAASGHFWLFFVSHKECSELDWDFESDQVELLFVSFSGLKVKACGFHPIFLREVEELDQAANKQSLSTIYNVGEDIIMASKIDVTTTSKRSLTDYVPVGASGSGSWDDDEEPQAKRFKKFE